MTSHFEQASGVLQAALDALAGERPAFYSEADFQHALAWMIQRQHPDARVRLEIPLLAGGSERLDLLVLVDGLRLAVELKYPRAGFAAEVIGEPIPYRRDSPDAIDDTRYAIALDLRRLERLIEEGAVDVGAVVVLTNASGFWTRPRQPSVALDAAFRLHETNILAGDLVWGEGGREKAAVSLSGTYTCAWREFSVLESGTGARNFRCLVLVVPGAGCPEA